MIASNIVTIVPFFNRRNTILATLESIRAQTIPPEQLIVVDDGSTDGGGETVRRWMHTVGGSLHCRLIRQSNFGAAMARNHGLSQAVTSEFVAFLDSDDCWPDDFLARTGAALSDCDTAVAATCDRQVVYADGRATYREDCSGLTVNPILWMLRCGAGVSSATLFRRSAIESRGGFPHKPSGEDAALFLPLSLDGSWLHVPGEPVTFHKGLSEQLGDEGNLSEKFADNYRIWATIFDEFLSRDGTSAPLVYRECKKPMAYLWYQAGKELWDTQSPREVLTCFQRSLAWNPWRGKCYWRMLRAWIKSIGHASIPVYSDRRATAVSA